jgi:LDH2 family malate/lactate/ureidoglycolate dehydrogenase
MYINDLLHHICDGEAIPKIIKDKGACAWVDGKNALGPVVANFCMDMAIKKVRYFICITLFEQTH